MTSLDEVLGRLVGERIAGGCDDCAAYQEVERDGTGVWHIHVFHDDNCPWLNARTS